MYYQEIEGIFSIDTLFLNYFFLFMEFLKHIFLVISKLNKCIKVNYLQKILKLIIFTLLEYLYILNTALYAKIDV